MFILCTIVEKDKETGKPSGTRIERVNFLHVMAYRPIKTDDESFVDMDGNTRLIFEMNTIDETYLDIVEKVDVIDSAVKMKSGNHIGLPIAPDDDIDHVSEIAKP